VELYSTPAVFSAQLKEAQGQLYLFNFYYCTY